MFVNKLSPIGRTYDRVLKSLGVVIGSRDLGFQLALAVYRADKSLAGGTSRISSFYSKI